MAAYHRATMKKLPRYLLIALIYAAFISLGLPDSALGVAWPAMRATWSAPIEAVGIVTLIVTLGSALSGFASGWVLKKLGTGPVLFISCVLTGGAFLGISMAPSFGWLLALAIPLGLGAGSVDAGLNHFVAEHYSTRHMNWLHGCWGVGATLGPVIMSAAIAGTGWASGYRTISIVQLSLALIFLASLALWKKEGAIPPRNAETASARPAASATPAWAAWLGPSLYFVYTAMEIGTGLWGASILVGSRGFSPARAGMAMSFFYGAIMVGRFLTGVIAEKIGNRKMVRAGLVVAVFGAVLFMAAGAAHLPAITSVAGLALLGLGCAPVYPCLMHETPRRFDEETSRSVVGRQVAFAYVGGAVVPPAFGLLAAHAGLEAVMPGVAVMAILLLALSEKLNSAT